MVPNFQTLLIINSDLYLASPPARTKGQPAEGGAICKCATGESKIYY